jgi:hypothetical protein
MIQHRSIVLIFLLLFSSPAAAEFCQDLNRIFEGDRDFNALAGKRIDEKTWTGVVQPDGLSCSIRKHDNGSLFYTCLIGQYGPEDEGINNYKKWVDTIASCLSNWDRNDNSMKKIKSASFYDFVNHHSVTLNLTEFSSFDIVDGKVATKPDWHLDFFVLPQDSSN